jgi:hypothetical protein
MRSGVLHAVFTSIKYVVPIAIAVLFIGLADEHVLPSGFFFVGSFMILTIGVTFVVRGVGKKRNFEEDLLKINPIGPDHLFLNLFGKRYFYLKSILLGVCFIIFGIFLIYQKWNLFVMSSAILPRTP